MSRLMRPLSYRDLVSRALAEYRAKNSIFEVPAEQFSSAAFLPIGPAAGPHTQLAQNIVASWLAGARCIELKTVQVLDALVVPKPCIDAADEGYNVEWSSELSIEQAYDEYLKAWFLLHLFETLMSPGNHGQSGPVQGPPAARPPSFLFIMSVGYDLKGIKSPKVDRFIGRLSDSSHEELFARYGEETGRLAQDHALFAGTPWRDRASLLASLRERVPPRICRMATLSTMHGCPPREIESICAYLLDAKGLDASVKINPTLLGFSRVRGILDHLGFDYVELDQRKFAKDLQWRDAVPMLERLLSLATARGRTFGVKLSNTLACRNAGRALPGAERYLSGRPLYPVTMRLAAELCGHFGDRLPISFSAGISAWNIAETLGCGLRPITLATELLKPGGYGRLKQLAEIAAPWEGCPPHGRVDPRRVQAAAEAAMESAWCRKEFRGSDRVQVDGPLPLFDCFVAPCVRACPICQDVPEYVTLAGTGRFQEAFALIYDRNPLPFTTGRLCDHRCMISCSRRDWEGPVRIRELKRIAAERGYGAFRASGSLLARKGDTRKTKTAIIGAGPAGLAAASFLAREGFEVHLFEREKEPGGVVRHALPGFRVVPESLEHEVTLLRDLDVLFHLGIATPPTVAELKTQGFAYVIVAIGADIERGIGVSGALPAIAFLRQFRKDPQAPDLGRSVVVVGAGDTAMDAARAARRCRGVEEARVVYRRSRIEMPASAEEYQAAVADGIRFSFLRSPQSWKQGSLVCRVMKLGAPDASGRPRPIATRKTEPFHADSVISATGAEADRRAVSGIVGCADGEITVDPKTQETSAAGVFLIGDAAAGAATIVEAIASARRAVDAICSREGGGRFRTKGLPHADARELRGRRDRLIPPAAEGADDEAMRSVESARCLDCRALCVKCVEVCPNRANTCIRVPGPFHDEWQIVHLDGLCNECGNCATFCPWDGKPYRDKFTVFSTQEDFQASSNPGFFVASGRIWLRSNGSVSELVLSGPLLAAADAVRPEVRSMVETILRDYSYLVERTQ